MLTAQDIADALDGDRGTIQDPDTGLAFTWSIEYDHCTQVTDFDCYGDFSGGYSYTANPPNRPEHFTGAACKIEYDRGSWLWWQPPAGIPQADIPAFRSHVRDILEQGFYLLALDVTEEVESKHLPGLLLPVRIDAAAMGGIEPSADPAYLRTIAEDLAGEMLSRLPAYN